MFRVVNIQQLIFGGKFFKEDSQEKGYVDACLDGNNFLKIGYFEDKKENNSPGTTKDKGRLSC